MKKIISTLAMASILAVAISSCSSSTEHKQDTTTPEQQASLYQCPMQCEGDKTYDKPGKCPVCGMDLAPVETSAPLNTDTVHTTGDSTAAV